jgi:hypothetical protein
MGTRFTMLLSPLKLISLPLNGLVPCPHTVAIEIKQAEKSRRAVFITHYNLAFTLIANGIF